MEEIINKNMKKEKIGIGTTTHDTFITLSYVTLKEYRKAYTLRTRIGLNILRLIGIVKLEIGDK